MLSDTLLSFDKELSLCFSGMNTFYLDVKNCPLKSQRIHLLSGDLFVIVFSMDSRETFEEAIRLREQILETKINAGASANSGGLTRKKTLPRVPMILAGNKTDKEMK
jgi:hypothetical protein